MDWAETDELDFVDCYFEPRLAALRCVSAALHHVVNGASSGGLSQETVRIRKTQGFDSLG